MVLPEIGMNRAYFRGMDWENGWKARTNENLSTKSFGAYTRSTRTRGNRKRILRGKGDSRQPSRK